QLNLTAAGTWELESPYVSRLPIEVTAPGLKTTLPPNLDRPGPRLPVGRITVDRPRRVTISFHVEDKLLAPATAVASFGYVAATRLEKGDRVVPIERACGRYVDWYRSAG
ncbi:MAG TPA: hypothetical protein VNN15_08700, partial [Solirubrobacterales bacterium]|nr:hypothetical protein [Solirubrobacterales bacterium]